MNTTIRTARLSDAGKVEDLLYSSGPEGYDHIYKKKGSDPLEYLAFEFISGKGMCGYPNVTIIESETDVLGAVCFYSGTEYKELGMASLKNMFKYLGLERTVRALILMRHTNRLLTIPRANELYIMNLGIKEGYRGMGLGSQLINHIVNQAEAFDAETVSLDVATNNPMAEKLYSRLGFSVVNVKQPPDIFSHLPGSKKMEMKV